MNVSVILPSLNPSENLLKVVEGVLAVGFTDIIMIDDGSDSSHRHFFTEAASLHPEVTVLTHEVNRGKGAALKTAYAFCMEHRPDIDGVVTVDGDNQHLPKDIKACTEAMLAQKDTVVLGCRQFDGPNVPAKSRFGNNMTRFVFRFCCSIKISDTQTGLRAIPASLLPFMASVKGERYEYETQVLLDMKKAGIAFSEVPIETVYIDDNSESHFHPIRDSFKIYKVILSYTLVSILSWVIDISLFTILEFLFESLLSRSMLTLVATFGSRACSSLFNYFMNRKTVFESKSSIKKTMPRYYALCIAQALVSYGLVNFISLACGSGNWFTSLIKIVVDLALYLISFQIQRKWVFADRKN